MSRKKPRDSVGTSLKDLLRDVSLDPEPKTPEQRPGPRRRARGDGVPPARPEPASDAVASPPTGREPASDAVASPPTGPEARPSASLRGDDRIAFHDALAGVRPLDAPRAAGRRRSRAPARRASPVVPREAPSDVEARARLAALVGGGVRFDLDKDADGGIQGLRAGADPSVLRELRERNAFVEATLDLHGMRGDEAERRVTRFVRAEHRRGLRRLCIVHGKGLHSESGAAVLRDRVVHALSEGGAAPVVLAFATAAPDRGGHGALLVALTRRR